MNSSLWVALIGAIATLGAALINKINLDKKTDEEKKKMKTSFMRTKTFTWLVAPIAGALITLLAAHVISVLAASSGPLNAPVCLANNFYPSGYMGDGEGENKKGTDPIDLNDQWTQNCHSDPTCIRVVYHPPSNKWAGVYWQNPDGNWGDEPGRTILGAKKLVFWARGDRGGEVVSFKVGGINNKKYKDSLERPLGPVRLTTEWQHYEIDLSDADTSSVIGAFAWIASAKGNPNGLTFYLEGICFTK
jgi:hypothetical protein